MGRGGESLPDLLHHMFILIENSHRPLRKTSRPTVVFFRNGVRFSVPCNSQKQADDMAERLFWKHKIHADVI